MKKRAIGQRRSKSCKIFHKVNVATCLRCGGIFVTNLLVLTSLTAKLEHENVPPHSSVDVYGFTTTHLGLL